MNNVDKLNEATQSAAIVADKKESKVQAATTIEMKRFSYDKFEEVNLSDVYPIDSQAYAQAKAFYNKCGFLVFKSTDLNVLTSARSIVNFDQHFFDIVRKMVKTNNIVINDGGKVTMFQCNYGTELVDKLSKADGFNNKFSIYTTYIMNKCKDANLPYSNGICFERYSSPRTYKGNSKNSQNKYFMLGITLIK